MRDLGTEDIRDVSNLRPIRISHPYQQLTGTKDRPQNKGKLRSERKVRKNSNEEILNVRRNSNEEVLNVKGSNKGKSNKGKSNQEVLVKGPNKEVLVKGSNKEVLVKRSNKEVSNVRVNSNAEYLSALWNSNISNETNSNDRERFDRVPAQVSLDPAMSYQRKRRGKRLISTTEDPEVPDDRLDRIVKNKDFTEIQASGRRPSNKQPSDDFEPSNDSEQSGDFQQRNDSDQSSNTFNSLTSNKDHRLSSSGPYRRPVRRSSQRSARRRGDEGYPRIKEKRSRDNDIKGGSIRRSGTTRSRRNRDRQKVRNREVIGILPSSVRINRLAESEPRIRVFKPKPTGKPGNSQTTTSKAESSIQAESPVSGNERKEERHERKVFSGTLIDEDMGEGGLKNADEGLGNVGPNLAEEGLCVSGINGSDFTTKFSTPPPQSAEHIRISMPNLPAQSGPRLAQRSPRISQSSNLQQRRFKRAASSGELSRQTRGLDGKSVGLHSESGESSRKHSGSHTREIHSEDSTPREPYTRDFSIPLHLIPTSPIQREGREQPSPGQQHPLSPPTAVHTPSTPQSPQYVRRIRAPWSPQTQSASQTPELIWSLLVSSSAAQSPEVDVRDAVFGSCLRRVGEEASPDRTVDEEIRERRLILPSSPEIHQERAATRSESTRHGLIPTGIRTKSSPADTRTESVPTDTRTESMSASTRTGSIPAGTTTESMTTGTRIGSQPTGPTTVSMPGGFPASEEMTMPGGFPTSEEMTMPGGFPTRTEGSPTGPVSSTAAERIISTRTYSSPSRPDEASRSEERPNMGWMTRSFGDFMPSEREDSPAYESVAEELPPTERLPPYKEKLHRKKDLLSFDPRYTVPVLRINTTLVKSDMLLAKCIRKMSKCNKLPCEVDLWTLTQVDDSVFYDMLPLLIDPHGGTENQESSEMEQAIQMSLLDAYNNDVNEMLNMDSRPNYSGFRYNPERQNDLHVVF